MEPITAVTTALQLGNGAALALTNATKGVKAAWRRLQLAGTYEPEWLSLDLESPELQFTATEAADIDKFLSCARVTPLLSFLALAALAPPAASDTTLIDLCEAAFFNEIQFWKATTGAKWAGQSEVVWNALLRLYRSAMPISGELTELAEEVEYFSDFLISPLTHVSDYQGTATAYLNRLSNLARNTAAIWRASDLTAELGGIIAAVGYEPIISHSDVEHAVSFSALYVSRTIVDADSGNRYPLDSLIASGTPFRVVLMGSPGAGKTTFVRHFVKAMADTHQRTPIMPVHVIRCREYRGVGWRLSIQSYIAETLNTAYSLSLSIAELEDLLLLGKLALVFDGLDEITDRSVRGELVQRIQAFAARYPPVSILVTTREVGYERAPLNRFVFNHLRLEEFSWDQTQEYCHRWFTSAGRTDLVTSFLAESETVSDLRTNPLLLSLLCILYRENGAIPSNRRDIYARCADLLFHRWDTHRQIDQHESMPKFGDRIMQEIAKWFFTSPSTASGLDEQVLTKVIAAYMADVIGMQPGNAEATARDFLAFCADRAWLLGSVGTNATGVRLFRFTHRTFYELFAAEAFARESKDTVAVTAAIQKSFSSDATSVMPELLIQSYDAHNDRGAVEVFTAVCSGRDVPPALVIRLMEGSILPRYARRAGLDHIQNRWLTTSGGMKASEFNTFLGMNIITRSLYLEEYLLEPENTDARLVFMHGWASLDVLGGTGRFRDMWGPVAQRIVDEFFIEIAEMKVSSICNWGVYRGYNTSEPESPWEYLAYQSASGWTPGVVWNSIDLTLRGDVNLVHQGALSRMHSLHKDLTDTKCAHRIPDVVLERLCAALALAGFDPTQFESIGQQTGIHAKAAAELLSILALAQFEATGEGSVLDQSANRLFGVTFDQVFAVRRHYAANADNPPLDVRRQAHTLLRALPERCRIWAMNGAVRLSQKVPFHAPPPLRSNSIDARRRS